MHVRSAPQETRFSSSSTRFHHPEMPWTSDNLTSQGKERAIQIFKNRNYQEPKNPNSKRRLLTTQRDKPVKTHQCNNVIAIIPSDLVCPGYPVNFSQPINPDPRISASFIASISRDMHQQVVKALPPPPLSLRHLPLSPILLYLYYSRNSDSFLLPTRAGALRNIGVIDPGGGGTSAPSSGLPPGWS